MGERTTISRLEEATMKESSTQWANTSSPTGDHEKVEGMTDVNIKPAPNPTSATQNSVFGLHTFEAALRKASRRLTPLQSDEEKK